MTPAVGETPLGVNTTAFGVLKFGVIQHVEQLRAKLESQPFAQTECPSTSKNPTWRGPGRSMYRGRDCHRIRCCSAALETPPD